MTKPLWQFSAVDIRQGILNREFSATEVCSSVCQRMADVNPTYNAVVLDLSEQALNKVDSVDRNKTLAGVPVTIKENLDLLGCPTPNGVPAFSSLMPTSNAPVSQHLLDAGASVIGRTNTPEFSIRWQTDNPLHGLTINPWNPELTCGGSSGGAAVSTMLGFGPIAHGNDIGGSLRSPAFSCGATTVRPTFGRVPAFNSTFSEERPFIAQTMSTQGIIAREVKDVRLATAVISAFDARDPFWVPAPFDESKSNEKVKIAFTTSSYGLPIHPAIIDAVRTAAKILDAAGYILEEIDPPEVEHCNEVWRNLLFSEFKRKVDSSIKLHGSKQINTAMAGYYSVSRELDLEGTMDALAERNRLLRQWIDFQQQYPLILSPLLLQPTYSVGEDVLDAASAARTLMSYLYMTNNNLLGLPAATISTGLHNGTPIGVQLTGARFQENLCLSAAECIERNTGVMAHKLWDQLEAQTND